uniref:Uncharacterized protein n=1 Tax=Ficedula albicollis TaxID=59894 RepID=A0A803VJR8_FICAL
MGCASAKHVSTVQNEEETQKGKNYQNGDVFGDEYRIKPVEEVKYMKNGGEDDQKIAARNQENLGLAALASLAACIFVGFVAAGDLLAKSLCPAQLSQRITSVWERCLWSVYTHFLPGEGVQPRGRARVPAAARRRWHIFPEYSSF